MILEAAFAVAIDGDTLALGDQRVRLWGIQAPELSMPQGRASKATLAALLLEGATTCHVWTKDRYGRRVGQCYVKGEDVAWRLVRADMARDWPHYSKGYYATSWRAFCDARGAYCSLERK
jgi:endonuclease YncB( thermonuclease family)